MLSAREMCELATSDVSGNKFLTEILDFNFLVYIAW